MNAARKILAPLWLVGAAVLVIAVGLIVPRSGTNDTGLLALWSPVLAVLLLAVVLVTAVAAGVRLLDRFRMKGLSGLEQAAIGLALGVGLLSQGLLILGLLGLYRPVALLGWLFVLAAYGGPRVDLGRFISMRTVYELRRSVAKLDFASRVMLALMFVMFALGLLNALTPAYGYDGLMYHLYAPREYLRLGAIELLDGPVQTNYPLGFQLIFGLGLIFESTIFARLAHLAFAIWLALLVHAGAVRWLGYRGRMIAVAVLVSTPIYVFWAQNAMVDMVWAYFEFLAVFLLLIWYESRSNSWLILSAIVLGLAIGMKYQALFGAIALGLWVLWLSRRDSLKTLIARTALFAGLTLLVSAPWFIKNWTLTGNPIFPYLFGGRGYTESQLEYLFASVSGFGVGYGFPDYFLIPIKLLGWFTNQLTD